MMESNVIKIKCPKCGAVLRVKEQQGIEKMRVTCPVCKEGAPFSQFNSASSPEKYVNADDRTSITIGANFTLGQLKLETLDLSPYRLKMGKNIVGRKAKASSADFQIPTGDKKRMSREHLVIEVVKVPDKGLVHYASLYKASVNVTSINHERIQYGDRIILNHGDVLMLPDVNLVFEIPDEEETLL